MGENNKATVVGRFTKGFTYSYCMHGENFYTTEIAAERLSGNYDYIPVTISEHLIDVREDFTGEPVELVGDFRSYNKQRKNRSHLILTLMAQEITFVDDSEVFPEDKIFLDGFICKPPTYRRTPLGREIAEILLAVNRPYERSDYIPCICWGRNARWARKLPVGIGLTIHGRIQSREYGKEPKMAYEVSINNMGVRINENSGIKAAQC